MVPSSSKCCRNYLFLAKSCGTILGKTLSVPFDFGQKLWYHPWQYIVRAVCFGPNVMVPSSPNCCLSDFLSKSCGTILGKTLAEFFVLGQSLWYLHHQNAVRAFYIWPKVVVPFLAKTLSEPFDFGHNLKHHSLLDKRCKKFGKTQRGTHKTFYNRNLLICPNRLTCLGTPLVQHYILL